ncbi:MAG: hypothetical protein RDU14_00985 [Melioribacteraceae bacterium]|nr:hypothetical protein [Melioribacteraceae bacterium]
MSILDVKWDPKEKKIARAAFDKAYQREMGDIKAALRGQIAKLKDDEMVWSIHNYLSDRRSKVDNKYDYRYSQLLLVFGRLLKEGYLKEEDLFGLSDDKIKLIKSLSSNK